MGDTESTRRVVQRYFDALRADSGGDFLAEMADDVVWHLPPHHLFGSAFEGKEAILGMLGRGVGMFDLSTISVERLFLMADGENATAHFEMSAKTGAGRDYRNEYMFRFTVRDGKIVEVWEIMDTKCMHDLGMFEGL